jgi:hypothetical protein
LEGEDAILKDFIRKALMRKIAVKKGKGKAVIQVEPNPRLVYGVKFAVAMTLCLTALEMAHMALLGRWNSEIFAAITGLIGTISGIFISQKA